MIMLIELESHTDAQLNENGGNHKLMPGETIK